MTPSQFEEITKGMTEEERKQFAMKMAQNDAELAKEQMEIQAQEERLFGVRLFRFIRQGISGVSFLFPPLENYRLWGFWHL